MNPIVGDLFGYTAYLSELGIKDLLIILEECFEKGMTQEEARTRPSRILRARGFIDIIRKHALEYFKDKTEQDFTGKDAP